MNKYTNNDVNRNLLKVIEDSFKESFDLPAFTDYDTNETFTYGSAAQEIARLHALFRTADLKAGDKVALMGADSARWCIIFIATITYGAVIVPILQDFNPQDAERIIDHSDSRILFLDQKLRTSIDLNRCPQVEILLGIEELDIVHVAKQKEENEKALRESIAHRERWKLYSEGGSFARESICFAQRDNSEVMYINYTSGTTGVSKGVLLTGQNIAGNALYAHRLDLMYRGHRELCFLPLAHAYSCAFNLITPITMGAHVTILGKVPSPRVIMAAFAKVRPQLIITVPLILEKIYKQAIAPKLEQPLIKFLTHIPGLKSIVYKSIRRKLEHALGGEFREVIVGGAALSEQVGTFLKDPIPTNCWVWNDRVRSSYQLRKPQTLGTGELWEATYHNGSTYRTRKRSSSQCPRRNTSTRYECMPRILQKSGSQCATLYLRWLDAYGRPRYPRSA